MKKVSNSLKSAAVALPLLFGAMKASDLEAMVTNEAKVTIQVNDAGTGFGVPQAIVDAVNKTTPGYTYQKETDDSGSATIDDFYTFVRGDKTAVPKGYQLTQNFPNPFNPSTTMRFGIVKRTDVDVRIYNIKGQAIKTLVDDVLNPGLYEIGWGGTDERRLGVVAGVYIARMTTDDGFDKGIKILKVDGGAGAASTELKKLSYFVGLGKTAGTPQEYEFRINRDGYTQIIDNVTIKGDTTLVYQLTPESNQFRAFIIDNKTLEKVVSGIIEVDGVQYRTDRNGMVMAPTNGSKITSVTAWGKDAATDTTNTFSVTYRNVPMDTVSWLNPAGLMVTTYKDLTDVDVALRVNPSLFRDFMQEGNMGYIGAPAHGLRSIDWQHAQNPVPNPNGPHGYVYWIDRDYANGMFPGDYRTFSLDEQLYIKDVIEMDIMTHIRDTTQKPMIYLAQAGETLPIKAGKIGIQPDDGILFTTHRPGGNGYTFAWKDYENNGVKDGIIDAAIIGIGDPTNIDEGIRQEAGSIIVLNGIYNQNMSGRTVNSEGGATAYLTPADLKMLGIELNVSNYQWQLEKLPNDSHVRIGHYKPLQHIDDIIGIKQ